MQSFPLGQALPVPSFGPGELTVYGVLIFFLGLLSRRVLALGYQLDEKDKEIERLRIEKAQAEAKRDEYLHKLLEAGRIGVETLPKIQRSLDEGKA